MDRQQAIAEAWKRGILSYKLYPVQKVIYDRIMAFLSKKDLRKGDLKYLLNCCRRLGKSFVLSLIAIEHAIRNPSSEVRFAAPTMKALKKIILPNFRKILKDCPKDLRPTWKAADLRWEFSNGSIIDISGANSGHAENLRGSASSLSLVDEAGTITELDYLITDILMPQLMTTGGKLLIASTPPRRRAKEFKALCIEAEQAGNYSLLTIDDVTHIPQEVKDTYMEECGGPNSPAWLREFFCQFDVNEDIKITPSFRRAHILPTDWIVPKIHQYFDKYEAFDYGRTDAFVTLFAFWHPIEKRLYVQRELKLVNEEVTPERVKAGIKTSEEALAFKQIHKRTSDGAHLIDIPGKPFTPVIKGRKDEMVGKVNDWLAAGKIAIHPSCRFLIACLEHGEWNARRTDFARTPELLHVDATDALVYMVLGVDEAHNPIPKDIDPQTGEKMPIKDLIKKAWDPLDLRKKPQNKLETDRYTGYGSRFDSLKRE